MVRLSFILYILLLGSIFMFPQGNVIYGEEIDEISTRTLLIRHKSGMFESVPIA